MWIAVAELEVEIRNKSAADMSFFLQSDRGHSQVVEVAEPISAVGRGLVAVRGIGASAGCPVPLDAIGRAPRVVRTALPQETPVALLGHKDRIEIPRQDRLFELGRVFRTVRTPVIGMSISAIT